MLEQTKTLLALFGSVKKPSFDINPYGPFNDYTNTINRHRYRSEILIV